MCWKFSRVTARPSKAGSSRIGVYWAALGRLPMKRIQRSCLLAVMLLFASAGFAQTPAGGLTPAQMNAKAKAQNVPEIAFDSVPNFLKLPPNVFLGEGIGVATNSKGHIFVYTRSQNTRLFE